MIALLMVVLFLLAWVGTPEGYLENERGSYDKPGAQTPEQRYLQRERVRGQVEGVAAGRATPAGGNS